MFTTLVGGSLIIVALVLIVIAYINGRDAGLEEAAQIVEVRRLPLTVVIAREIRRRKT